MPKIIPELREKILHAAKKHLLEDDAHDFSTRQLAADCGVAAGTIFNYFKTKEELLAFIILEDWQSCLMKLDQIASEDHIDEDSGDSSSASDRRLSSGLKKMGCELQTFCNPFLPIWQRYDQHAPIREHHDQLIGQLLLPVSTLLNNAGKACSEMELRVITEMLLAASLKAASSKETIASQNDISLQTEEDLIERLIPVILKIAG